MTADPKTRARLVYLQWLARAHPAVYRKSVQGFHGQQLGALGFINFIVQAVVAAGSIVMAKKQADKQLKLQKQTMAQDAKNAAADRAAQMQAALLQVNTDRAKSGLPPVDLNGNPIQSTSLSMPSALQSYAKAAGIDFHSATPWLIGGGVAVVGLLLVMRGK